MALLLIAICCFYVHRAVALISLCEVAASGATDADLCWTTLTEGNCSSFGRRETLLALTYRASSRYKNTKPTIRDCVDGNLNQRTPPRVYYPTGCTDNGTATVASFLLEDDECRVDFGSPVASVSCAFQGARVVTAEVIGEGDQRLQLCSTAPNVIGAHFAETPVNCYTNETNRTFASWVVPDSRCGVVTCPFPQTFSFSAAKQTCVPTTYCAKGSGTNTFYDFVRRSKDCGGDLVERTAAAWLSLLPRANDTSLRGSLDTDIQYYAAVRDSIDTADRLLQYVVQQNPDYAKSALETTNSRYAASSVSLTVTAAAPGNVALGRNKDGQLSGTIEASVRSGVVRISLQ
jgi:hypothetical protein